MEKVVEGWGTLENRLSEKLKNPGEMIQVQVDDGMAYLCQNYPDAAIQKLRKESMRMEIRIEVLPGNILEVTRL